METYNIPAVNMPELENRIAKINKRAARTGCQPVVIEVLREFVKKDSGDEIMATGMFEVAIIAPEIPKLSGWDFLATVDYVSEVGNLVSAVPGASIPEEYRSADMRVCDHCNQQRSRNKVYILRHEDGKTVQVGSTCLAEFLGEDPQAAARTLQYVFAATEALEEMERGGRGGDRVDAETFLAFVALTMETEGWTSKSHSRNYGGAATADVAWNAMFDR